MLDGFFNRMYYGDPRKPDLKKENVKANRFKLFFTVLQVRFWQLIQLNLLYSIFWIPMIFWNFIFMGALELHLNELNLEQLTQEQLQNLISTIFGVLLVLIPCLAITGPATAGVSYVLRKWANDEHAWVLTDFKDALKENWKQGLLMMLLNGVLIYLFCYDILFFYTEAIMKGNLVFLTLAYFIIMLALLLGMMNMLIFPMIVTYRLKLWQIIKNAFILTMIKLPIAFLIFLLVTALLILTSSFFMGVPLFVIGFTFTGLITASYANWLFDKYINNRPVPAGEEKEEE